MTYVSLRKPRIKQAEALALIENQPYFALLMAMRTGKTKIIVDDWGRMAASGQCMDLLVIAPAGVYLTWLVALQDDLPKDFKRATFVWSSKHANECDTRIIRDAFLATGGVPRVLLVNSEAVSAVRATRDICTQFLRQNPGCNMVVIDESVIIKNRKSVLSEFARKSLTPLAAYRRILTGLVSPRSPLDVYYQMQFLSPAIFPESYENFRERYAIVKRLCTIPREIVRRKLEVQIRRAGTINAAKALWGGDYDLTPFLQSRVHTAPEEMTRDDMVAAIFRMGGYVPSIPIINGYRHVDEINERIKRCSFRVRLEDCYDMPESDYSFRDVQLTIEQQTAYDEMRAFARAKLGEQEYVTASQVVVQMLRLHQIVCGHSMTDEGTPILLKQNRSTELVKLLSDYEGKAVVWCSYANDIDLVTRTLKLEFGDESVACFWGKNRSTREVEEVRFRNDHTCRFMVATQDAGGRGRTWDIADLCVYYSSRDNLDHRLQSEERIKANGKTRTCCYVDLRAPGTVEDQIIDALRKKLDLASIVSGDDWRSWLI